MQDSSWIKNANYVDPGEAGRERGASGTRLTPQQFATASIPMVGRSPKVLVGMSGGVDSSMAAALLIEQGFRVVGAYMKNWTLDVPGMQCPWAEDLAFAKRTAVKLGIDLRVYDFREAYKRDVVDYLVREYEAGRTPNPDIMCNQHVKFGLFLDTALEEGFDFVATGHYARRAPDITPTTYQPWFLADDRAPAPELRRAADDHKDQTYFLYRMGTSALARTLFPLGGYRKDQVRAMAAERRLPAANKPDSQGICFIGEAPIQDFLRLYTDPKPGKIVDADTHAVVGGHDGALFFTLGQRKGLGIGGGQPYYVVGKDMAKNEVYVSHSPQAEQLRTTELALEDCTWFAGESPAPGTYLVRCRHTGELVEAALDPQGETNAYVHFSTQQERVAPGQSVVVYQDQVCLGGGIVGS